MHSSFTALTSWRSEGITAKADSDKAGPIYALPVLVVLSLAGDAPLTLKMPGEPFLSHGLLGAVAPRQAMVSFTEDRRTAESNVCAPSARGK
jgi:hypothetical protein